ncbi:MAG: hypothetical protein HPY71_12590 [Firmicutes bacterium]|nr:hypothetical protein [Bacillota bacterium]
MNMLKWDMAPEELAQLIWRLYWDEELSQELVAARLGCSRTWIYRLMKRFCIPTRTQSQAIRTAIKHERIDFKQLRQKGIATMREEVRKGLRKWNRPGKYKSKIAALEKKMGQSLKEIFRSLYWDEGMSCQEIAEYLNKVMAELPGKPFKVCKTYASKGLRRFGIARRSTSEATKLAMSKLPPDRKARVGRRGHRN